MKTIKNKENNKNEQGFINPFTDFGFKKLFGEESENAMVSFLNDILPIDYDIVQLSYTNPEKLGIVADSRKAVYDIHCTDSQGNHFIVEIQNARQEYFKDRAMFYSTFPIQRQAKKGEWNFKLEPVYCIGLLGFNFYDSKLGKHEAELLEEEYLHYVKLKDQKNRIFYEKLTFIFVEFPKFNKQEKELATHLDKWLYFVKNLTEFKNVPSLYEKEEVFIDSFEKARVANLSVTEYERYQASALALADNVNIIDCARKEGLAEGKAAGLAEGEARGKAAGLAESKIKMAKDFIAEGVDINLVAKITKLPKSELAKLTRKKK